MHVTRVAVGHSRLVYVIVADKRFQYGKARSKVAYIGTTQNGVSRVAQSAACWTDYVLGHRGVKAFEVRIVFCERRQNVKTWLKLEHALLIMFREVYGQVPTCNTQGKRMRETDEFRYFARTRIRRILEDLA